MMKKLKRYFKDKKNLFLHDFLGGGYLGRNIARYITSNVGVYLRAVQRSRSSERLSCPVILNSVPKAGTNLLLNVVLQVPQAFLQDEIVIYNLKSNWQIWGLEALSISPRFYYSLVERKVYNLLPGKVFVGHNPYTSDVAKFIDKWKLKHILIIRDPRDYVVSLTYFVGYGNHIRRPAYDQFKSHDEKLLASILGIGEGKFSLSLTKYSVPNVKILYESYEEWLSHKNTLVIRYEDFVGEDGISPNIKEAMRKILNYLEVEPTDDIVEKMINEGMKPEKSHTFRKGRVGEWKKEFKEIHFEAFEKIGGVEILKKFGYS